MLAALGCAFFALMPAIHVGAQPRPAASSVAFVDVTIVDVTGGPSQPGMTVIVDRGEIVGVGKTGAVTVPKAARVVKASGKYAIPGLWDMHVHLYHFVQDRSGSTSLPLFIANGITAVRDAGGTLEYVDGLRARIKEGSLIGPRIVRAGSFIEGPPPPSPPDPSRLIVHNPEEARKAVRMLKSQGVDFVKVHGRMPFEVVAALVDEAKKQNMPAQGHATVTPEQATDLGFQVIDHEVFSDDARQNAVVLSKLVKNGTWNIPVLVQPLNSYPSDDPNLRYIPKSVRQKWERTWPVKPSTPEETNARRANTLATQAQHIPMLVKAGVPLLAGTDTGYRYLVPGFSLHDELGLLVRAGLTPLQALQTATINPAKLFRLEAVEGTIAAGKHANFILLNGNPLSDIANTRKIDGVIVNGRYLPKRELDKMLASVEKLAPGT